MTTKSDYGAAVYTPVKLKAILEDTYSILDKVQTEIIKDWTVWEKKSREELDLLLEDVDIRKLQTIFEEGLNSASSKKKEVIEKSFLWWKWDVEVEITCSKTEEELLGDITDALNKELPITDCISLNTDIFYPYQNYRTPKLFEPYERRFATRSMDVGQYRQKPYAMYATTTFKLDVEGTLLSPVHSRYKYSDSLLTIRQILEIVSLPDVELVNLTEKQARSLNLAIQQAKEVSNGEEVL